MEKAREVGSSRISSPGGLNVLFRKSCLSVDGAELPDHSGTRPFSLKLSVPIVPVPCGMV